MGCKDLFKCLLQLSEPDSFELQPPTHSKRNGRAVLLRPNSLLGQDLQQKGKVITQRHIPGNAPSWMQISTVLNHRHITCVL